MKINWLKIEKLKIIELITGLLYYPLLYKSHLVKNYYKTVNNYLVQGVRCKDCGYYYSYCNCINNENLISIDYILSFILSKKLIIEIFNYIEQAEVEVNNKKTVLNRLKNLL